MAVRRRGGKPTLFELKVVTPLASSQSGEARQNPAGAVAAFANTVPHYNNVIFGPPPSSRSQAVGDYREALDKGYKVKALVLETFGGFSPVLLKWFKAVAAVRQDRLTSSQSMDATWTQVSYSAYHAPLVPVQSGRRAGSSAAGLVG